MSSAKFTWRRLGAALGLGLAIEILLLPAAILIGSETVGDWMQAPASILVRELARLTHPGFEEQVAYVLLIPLLQWIFYSTVVFIVLVRRVKNPAHVGKENSILPKTS